jgi:hypothetical protein
MCDRVRRAPTDVRVAGCCAQHVLARDVQRHDCLQAPRKRDGGDRDAADTACTWLGRVVGIRYPRNLRQSRHVHSARRRIGAPTVARGGPAIASPDAGTCARHMRRSPRGRRSRHAWPIGGRSPQLVHGAKDVPALPSRSGSSRQVLYSLGFGSTPATRSSTRRPPNGDRHCLPAHGQRVTSRYTP